MVIQFFLLIYLFSSGCIFPSNKILLFLELFAIIFGIWAMYEFKFRFNITPDLKENSKLMRYGPYKFVRHPMYSALIIMTLALVINDFTFFRIGAWIFLVLVLNYKSNIEEKYLNDKFTEYSDYKLKTKKLVPYIF
ncbi:MAG TPA: isoprenylcysteine carboxylmethyltransferase family protein [Ignavibacteria bacterium]|nr:isoprenylcysteine carboxylmethyltransferase family protein [Ignavibacteria bacterium]